MHLTADALLRGIKAWIEYVKLIWQRGHTLGGRSLLFLAGDVLDCLPHIFSFEVSLSPLQSCLMSPLCILEGNFVSQYA